MIDVRNGELALRKARIALITQVQAQYYAVLVAEETVRITEALARFTDESYRIQIEQVRRRRGRSLRADATPQCWRSKSARP